MPRLLPDSESVIIATRLELLPQKESHADAMFSVLSSPELYRHTGGSPPISRQALAGDYRFLEKRRSPDESELWLNWIVHLKDDGPIGYVQATISDVRAAIAWVIGARWQGNGYATEAASAMKDWIQDNYAVPIRACVSPNHPASQRVAAKIGLRETDELIEGERVWTSQDSPSSRRP